MNQFILTKKFAYSLLKMGAFFSLFVLQVEEILIYSSIENGDVFSHLLKVRTILTVFQWEPFCQSFESGGTGLRQGLFLKRVCLIGHSFEMGAILHKVGAFSTRRFGLFP